MIPEYLKLTNEDNMKLMSRYDEFKDVVLLKRQKSSWDIVSSHRFSDNRYKVDKYGNFYRDGVLSEVKPNSKKDKVYFLIDEKGNKLRFKLHQIIMQSYFPEGIKSGLSVDHIDRNRLNNNLYNLRYASRTQQYKNRDNVSYKFKKVKCLNNGIIYESCRSAEIDLKLVFNTVSRVARGERKYIKGYNFKYV